MTGRAPALAQNADPRRHGGALKKGRSKRHEGGKIMDVIHNKRVVSCGRRVRLPLILGLAAAASVSAAFAQTPAQTPIVIDRMGSFAAGGEIIGDPETASLSCDHGFVEYQIPVNPRSVSLFMWHSSSVAVWQNRWDGGEGFQSMFLRQGYPVYLWDGPRVGRANWGCDTRTYESGAGRDQQNFTGWRLGETFPEWFDGVQFPVGDREAWNQATRARYEEFDTTENALLQAEAAAKALDRIGPAVVLTNSAGGFRALLAAMKTDNVKAIVAYENPGYVFPEGFGPEDKPRPFGPVHVPMSEFKKLTEIPIQFVFGDNIEKSERWPGYVELCRQFVEIVNANGGWAEILFLSDAGLKGNTHIPFADMNNAAVAGQLSQFLAKNGLDGRAAP